MYSQLSILFRLKRKEKHKVKKETNQSSSHGPEEVASSGDIGHDSDRDSEQEEPHFIIGGQ